MKKKIVFPLLSFVSSFPPFFFTFTFKKKNSLSSNLFITLSPPSFTRHHLFVVIVIISSDIHFRPLDYFSSDIFLKNSLFSI
ncbi:hypothetical protein DM01DRAFT_1105230 [Hesseltinella vesiculosa]|uniref:Uncharacterized protein n=1 Tax=Hesseltinella vesiculosa TaxID=101127 RepID=A0A1X2GAX2_9FUNG|nr:hypothetical protein DM01DRAFT_1105230 [Hesseltinella vesiculosa]